MYPYDISLDQVNGNIYVVDSGNNRIQIFNEKFEFIESIGRKGTNNGEFNCPSRIAFDEQQQRMYVVDQNNHRVQVFEKRGNEHQFLKCIGRCDGKEGTGKGEFRYPRSVCIDEDGLIYVSDFGNHRIQIFNNENGECIGMIGSEGTKKGEFKCPTGITVDEFGNIFVCDTNNHRIQVFYLKQQKRILSLQRMCLRMIRKEKIEIPNEISHILERVYGFYL